MLRQVTGACGSEAVPTWETIMLVYSRAFPTDERKVWTGLVSLDAEGYVVDYAPDHLLPRVRRPRSYSYV